VALGIQIGPQFFVGYFVAGYVLVFLALLLMTPAPAFR